MKIASILNLIIDKIRSGNSDTRAVDAREVFNNIATSYINKDDSPQLVETISASGPANNYIAAYTQTIAEYAEGVVYKVNFSTANTGPSTININSLGQKAIKRANGEDVSANDLQGVVLLVYRNNIFQLIGGQSINEDEFVKKTGNETIEGVKTFDSFPVLPDQDPEENNEAASKGYVDSTTVFLIESEVIGEGETASKLSRVFVDPQKIIGELPSGRVYYDFDFGLGNIISPSARARGGVIVGYSNTDNSTGGLNFIEGLLNTITGSASQNTISGRQNAINGTGSSSSSWNSISGYLNQMLGRVTVSSITGSGNVLDNISYFFLHGSNNSITGNGGNSGGVTIGLNNIISNPTNNYTGVVIGGDNNLTGSSLVVSGVGISGASLFGNTVAGRYIQVSGQNNCTIGSGVSSSVLLNNSISWALVIGQRTVLAPFFLEPGNPATGLHGWGRIAIGGHTDPTARLDVQAGNASVAAFRIRKNSVNRSQLVEGEFEHATDGRLYFFGTEKEAMAFLSDLENYYTIEELEGFLSTKVDVVAGMGLSQESFTTAEKIKLAGLSNYYLGDYPSLSALESAHHTANPGDYAIVDAGVGTDAIKYIWDQSDMQWVPGGGTGASAFSEIAGNARDNASLASEFNAIDLLLSSKLEEVMPPSLGITEAAMGNIRIPAVSNVSGWIANGIRTSTDLLAGALPRWDGSGRLFTNMGVNNTHAVNVLQLNNGLSGKANSVHTHIISDVEDLQTELDNKLDEVRPVDLNIISLAGNILPVANSSSQWVLNGIRFTTGLTGNTLPMRDSSGRVIVGSAIADNQATNLGQVNTSLAGKADLIDGKVPVSQLPDFILGQVEYKGIWNASTNTPVLPDPVTVKGNYYITNVGGEYEGELYAVGDWVISNGVEWGKVDNTDAVMSVNGKLGVVNLNATDVGAVAVNIPITGSTKTKITYDSKGLVVSGGDLEASDIPNLPASKITSGTNTAFNKNFGTTSDTVAEGNHNHNGVYEPVVSAGTTDQYYRGDKTFQTLNKDTVGLGNVDNTADEDKPVSNAVKAELEVRPFDIVRDYAKVTNTISSDEQLYSIAVTADEDVVHRFEFEGSCATTTTGSIIFKLNGSTINGADVPINNAVFTGVIETYIVSGVVHLMIRITLGNTGFNFESKAQVIETGIPQGSSIIISMHSVNDLLGGVVLRKRIVQKSYLT